MNSNKGHIHQRLKLRVKESIWLCTGGGGGEVVKEGKKGKISLGPEVMRAAEHLNKSIASGDLNAISRDKSIRQQLCQILKGRSGTLNTSGTAFTMLARAAEEVR